MLLNTFLNYCLIFGKFGAPALGITGAAIATLTARIVEFLIVLVYALLLPPRPPRPRLLLRPGRDTGPELYQIRHAGALQRDPVGPGHHAS